MIMLLTLNKQNNSDISWRFQEPLISNLTFYNLYIIFKQILAM
jgi:hypothetical protein